MIKTRREINLVFQNRVLTLGGTIHGGKSLLELV